MDPTVMLGLLILGIVAGIIGSLFGIGGGIIFIPVLTIIYKLPAMEAAAISLIGILALSAGAASYYTEHKVANVRLGLFLEIGTTIGAIIGAFLAGMVDQWVLFTLFSVFVIVNGLRMLFSHGRDCGSTEGEHEFYSRDLKTGETIGYDVQHRFLGSAICVFAGMYSSMTGVGGGVIKVPVMNSLMGVPMRAATATSSFMIGITAFCGAMVYFLNGQIDLEFAACIAISSYVGMLIGTRLSKHIDVSSLKRYFALVLFASAISVMLKAGGIL